MADDSHDSEIQTDGVPDSEGRTSGGCTLVSAILLLMLVALLVAFAWLRSRHEAPNPAMTGHPPSQRAH